MGELALTCLDRSSKETTKCTGASMGDLFKKGGRARAVGSPSSPSPGVLKH